MGALSTKFGVVGDDLKHSWYFRIYSLFWVVCVLTGFAALIIFGGRSAEFTKENSWRLWIEKLPAVPYPMFQFQTTSDEPTNVIGAPRCSHSGLIVHYQECSNGLPITKCVLIDPGNAVAAPLMNDLTCKFNVSAPTSADKMITFSIVDKDITSFGVNQLFITPTQNALVELDLATIKPFKGPARNAWSKRLTYKSSAEAGNDFNIDIEIGQFDIFHYEQTDFYTGWMAAADVGGAAFFLVILHTIVMGLISLCLENNSKYLKGTSYTEIS